jgi:hypothetical protein
MINPRINPMMNLGRQKTEDKSKDKSNDEFSKIPTTKYLFWVFHSLAG